MIDSGVGNPLADFFFETLLASSVPVIVASAISIDHPIVFVNEAFEAATGYSAVESIGQNSRFLQGRDTDQPALQELIRVIKEGKPAACVVRNYRKNGSMFLNHLHVYPLCDNEGLITYFVGLQHELVQNEKSESRFLEQKNNIELAGRAFGKPDLDAHVMRIKPAIGLKVDAAHENPTKNKMPSSEEQRCLDGHSATELKTAHEKTVKDHFRVYQGNDIDLTKNSLTIEKTKQNGFSSVHGRELSVRYPKPPEAQVVNQKIDLLLNSITEGCVSVDERWHFTFVNTESAKWLRKPKTDLLGKNLWDEFPEAVGSVFHETLKKAMADRLAGQCDAYYPPQGRWLDARAYPYEDGLVIFFLDISDRKRKENRLMYAGSYDQLTGLLNRETCLQRIEALMCLNEEERLGAISVLLLDLDKFKEVNDAVGHQAGDHVLRLLGMRFKGLSNESRFCARLSGDAFLFVLYPCTSAQAQTFAKRLLDEIIKPFDIAGQRLVVSASVGIATVKEDEKLGVSDLVNHADTAMYAVKASGRFAVQVFDAATAQASRRRLQLRNDLASAIESGQFVLHYQPQVRVLEGTIVGAEALIRWNHPAFGLLSPAAFLDIAEESPLILQLGAWVCDEACRQLAQWAALGHQIQIAINVSARQLIDSNFPKVLHQSVMRHQIDPKWIELEITESMLTQDFSVTTSMLIGLAKQGFRVALDDFGTGYSNLAYVNRLPIKVLKVDRSFIADLDRNPKSLALVKGIAGLAKSLNMEVICEGIETPAQRSAIEQTECDLIQGYLISKPLPADKFFVLLSKEGS